MLLTVELRSTLPGALLRVAAGASIPARRLWVSEAQFVSVGDRSCLIRASQKLLFLKLLN